MTDLFRNICMCLNDYPDVKTYLWEHEDFKLLNRMQQKSILTRLYGVIQKDPDQYRGGPLYGSTELIIDRVLRTIEPGEKSSGTEEVITEISRIYRYCKTRVIRENAPIDRQWTVTSMTLQRIYSYMQGYERTFPIIHNLVQDDYYNSIFWSLRRSEHALRDAVLVVSPQWLVQKIDECRKVFRLLTQVVKDNATHGPDTGIYKAVRHIINPLLNMIAHPVKGNKKGVVMIGDLNTVCEMAMMGRTVNDETLSGMVQAEILHVCMEDYELPASTFYGSSFLSVIERVLTGSQPCHKGVFLCCRNNDWLKLNAQDITQLYTIITNYVSSKPENTQKSQPWKFGIVVQCTRGLIKNIQRNPSLGKQLQRGGISGLAQFCCSKAWKLEPYVTGHGWLICDLEEDYVTTVGGVLFVILEEYLLVEKLDVVTEMKGVLLTIWENAEGEALAYATDIVNHLADRGMHEKSAQQLIGKYISGEMPELIVQLGDYYHKCSAKDQQHFHLQVMNFIRKMPSKGQTCFHTMDLLIKMADRNIRVFNGEHVQAVASLLADGIQAPKILQWLSIIADKRPEEVRHATRVIVHTTDFDDTNTPLVASILANVANVDKSQAPQCLDLLMTDMQYHDSNTKAAVLSSVKEIGRTVPKHLVRYKGEFEDMQSSPTTTAQCDDILNTIQVTQVLDKSDNASHKADRRSSKSDRPNPKQQLNVDHPKQQEPPRPSAEPPKSEPQVELNTITQSEENAPEVFLSYQWGKQVQIKALYAKLQEMGISCWMDIQMMGGGDALYASIDSGMRSCKVVLACVTHKYSMSANCRREVSLADSIKKPVIPLLLERIAWPPTGPMAMIFAELVYINFCKPSEDVQIKWDTPQWDELLLKIKAYTKTITKRKDQKKSTTNSIGPEKPKRQISQKQQKSQDKEESKKSSKICSVM